jgi:hypothetical protein
MGCFVTRSPRRAVLTAALACAATSVAPAAAHAQAAAAPATIAGVVREASGAAVTTATVALGTTPAIGVGARDGTFAFRGLGPGPVVLHVRAIGFQPVDTALTLADGQSLTVTIVLARAPRTLDSVRVRAATPPTDARRRGGSSIIIGRREIASRAPSRFSDVLRRVPGVSLIPVSTESGTTEYIYVMRGVATVKGRACPIAYFIDGHPTDAREGVDRMVIPAEIDSLEVYQSGSQAPARFSTSTSGRCGVIVIWTRSR